jgi:hypothetical protein
VAAIIVVLVMICAALAVLSWRAGGEQELREISQPVAVPEARR